MAEVKVIMGDSRDVLKTLGDCSIDSVVCDPPYALVSITKRFGKPGSKPAKGDVYQRAASGFMSQTWDTGETAFAVEFWAEVMRVLKPGGHVVAFSGTRTYHRLACAVEDAGFEIRDMLSWLYGSGFPKSHDVSKGIDKAAGAARDVVGPRRFANGTSPRATAKNFGVGDLDARSPTHGMETAPATPDAQQWTGWGTALKPACEPIVFARKPLDGTVAGNVLTHGTGALNIDACRVGTETHVIKGGGGGAGTGWGEKREINEERTGRFPANVLHDGSDEVVGAFPDSAGQQGDVRGTEPSSPTNGIYGGFAGRPAQAKRGDEVSAARFFYSSKADATDRLGSKHPTVKPTDLMRWLVRLVTPPGGTVLDPFAGSGSTGVACIAEGFDAILIEREAEYVADINRRIAWANGEGKLTAQELGKKQETVEALPLFGGAA